MDADRAYIRSLGCQWLGQGTQACARKDLHEHSVYCTEHYPQVYAVGTAVRRRKDARRAQSVWDLESAFNEAVQELESEGEL